MKLHLSDILEGMVVRTMLMATLWCSILLAACPSAVNAQLDPSMATGSTSSTHRKQAAARIPYRQMPPATARQVADVINNASLYRQLPVTSIKSDPDMYLFLLRYPETIIGTWRLMGITEMSARRTMPFRLQASDGAGTTTQAELVYGQPNLNIFYAEGEYEGPMILRKVTGSCVIVVESNYHRGQDGKTRVTSRMNFFLKIDNLAASIIAKTIHPLVGTTADHNFVETLKFAEKLSETSGRNGPGVLRMANRLDDLTPEVRQRFQEMAGVVWQRSQASKTQAQPAEIQTGYNEPQQQFPATYRTPAQRPGQHFYGQTPHPPQGYQQHRGGYQQGGYQIGDTPASPAPYRGPVMKRPGYR